MIVKNEDYQQKKEHGNSNIYLTFIKLKFDVTDDTFRN